eukprot:762514-Hanusia_phi.AAC.9
MNLEPAERPGSPASHGTVPRGHGGHVVSDRESESRHSPRAGAAPAAGRPGGPRALPECLALSPA